MASNTKKLKIRRKINAARAGKARKNQVRRLGTTAPNLPLDMPNAQEKAVKAAKS